MNPRRHLEDRDDYHDATLWITLDADVPWSRVDGPESIHGRGIPGLVLTGLHP